jgi:hypothetical protein
MKRTSLKDHKIIETMANAAIAVVSRLTIEKENGYLAKTTYDDYVLTSASAITSILECIDQLYFSVDLLSKYTNNHSPKDMNRYDHIRYSIENYYLRITSIYDRSLRVVNNAYTLGLPDRECRESTIINNTHIKGRPIASSLKDLDKFTQQFRNNRNSIAHQSGYKDEGLDNISPIFFLLEQERFTENKFEITNMSDSYVKAKEKELLEHIHELERIMDQFLDALNAKILQEINVNV